MIEEYEDYYNQKDAEVNYEQQYDVPKAKCWGIFAKVGKILGIISLAGTPLFLGLFVGEVGFVFTILGKKSRKSNFGRDLAFNIIGFVLSLIWYIVAVVILSLALVEAVA